MRVIAMVSTYKRPGVLAGCLRRIRKQTHPLDAIVVVDTAGDPETAQVVRNFAPVVHLRCHNDPYEAINAGMTKALDMGFDWLWVMDSDAWPRPDTLETMLKWARSMPDAQALVPVKKAGSRLITGVQWIPGKVPMRDIALPREPIRVDTAGWMANLLSRSWVQKVGLTTGEFFFGMGDLEYLLRGSLMGLNVYLIPEAVVDVAWLRDRLRRPVAGFPVRPRHYWYLKARNYTYFLLRLTKRPGAFLYYTGGLIKDWIKALHTLILSGESYPLSSLIWQSFGYGVGLIWSVSNELPGKRKGFDLGN